MNQFKLYVIFGKNYGKTKQRQHSAYVSASADIYAMINLLRQKAQENTNDKEN